MAETFEYCYHVTLELNIVKELDSCVPRMVFVTRKGKHTHICECVCNVQYIYISPYIHHPFLGRMDRLDT